MLFMGERCYVLVDTVMRAFRKGDDAFREYTEFALSDAGGIVGGLSGPHGKLVRVGGRSAQG